MRAGAKIAGGALRLLTRTKQEAIDTRLELSFEQSRSGEIYTPEEARQLLAERRASR